MAEILLDIPLIRDGKTKNFITYLNKLQEEYSEVSICRSLMEAVEREYISPNVFKLFVPWCRTPEIIILCMNYPSSRTIRKLGIKHFGKALAAPKKWEVAWKSVGGTQGLVDHLAKISVSEVQDFSRALGDGQGRRVPAREQAIEELLCALLPSHYPESRIKSLDKRPIQDHYAKIVTACSAKFIAQLLNDQDKSNPLYRKMRPLRLLKTHMGLVKERTLEAISNQGKKDDKLSEYLEAFCNTMPPEPSPYPRISAPMDFSMNMLRLHLEKSESMYWPTHLSEGQIYKDLLRRCIKKGLPKDKLLNVFSLGLKLLDKKSELKSEFRSSVVWNELTTRWRYSPEDYEELLAQAMRLDLGPSSNSIGLNVLSLSNKLQLKPSRLWDLLRLFCLHVPKSGDFAGSVVDLNIKSKTVDLKPLGSQTWSSKLFFTLEKHHAIRLLESLQISFPLNTFLSGPGSSILSGQNNSVKRIPILLGTLLQRDSPEEQVKVKAIVGEFRKKAATSGEQADRAEFAIAALQHSIASGSLDLYGDTVTWSQRFIRDPLTLKEVFGPKIVLTTEGIDLLSGIPDPLPENVTLEEVASSVEKANAILMTFHEHMLLAKREPSYQDWDWASVQSLFGSAIKKRVARAKTLQKRLLASEADIYAAIWAKTLALLETVNVKFLNEASAPIQQLIQTLPPTTLTGIAKSMLESGTERRKQKDRQPGDDILESLSYQVLLRVAKGDKPELVRRLVLDTILERPDASSWHRQFLSPRFMKSLTATQAQEMLLAFATAIGEKLDEQSYVKVGEAPPVSSAPPQSNVKITTIKYLAQLLDNADFISADAAIEVLVEVFKASTHRDIRLATLNSLFGLLNALGNGPRSNPLIEKILKALDTAIPVVGSINERRPPQEIEWKEAQDTKTLPEVSDKSTGLPPLMTAILNAPTQYPGIKNLGEEFVTRFFLPIYKLSLQEQDKWTAIFLAKYKSELKASDLPRLPISPKIWKILLQFYADVLPLYVLEDYDTYTAMTLTPPPALRTLNKSLKENLETANTPEVAHWLSLFDNLSPTYGGSGTKILVNMIYTTQISSALPTTGITHLRIQNMIVDQASRVLDTYEKHINFWNQLTLKLRHPCRESHPSLSPTERQEQVLKWQQTCRPVLVRIVQALQKKKSHARANGEFSLLPSEDLLLHWLLPFPAAGAELEGECQRFASELEGQLLRSLVGQDGNVLRWPRVVKDACTISSMLNSPEERLCVASIIGKLVASVNPNTDDQIKNVGGQKDVAFNLVKVSLAIHLIEKSQEGLNPNSWKEKDVLGEEKREVVVRRLRGVMGEWLGCESEEVRELAGEWVRDHGGIWARIAKGEEVTSGDGEGEKRKKGSR